MEDKPHHLGTHYMGSAQCTGYPKDSIEFSNKFTERVCNPSYSQIAEDIALVLHKNPHIRKVFVASDVKPTKVVVEVQQRFRKLINLKKLLSEDIYGNKVDSEVSFYWLGDEYGKDTELERDTMLDLALMVNSRMFIGSCSSTFSAFVSRYRKWNNVGVLGETRFENPNFYFGLVEDEWVVGENYRVNLKRKQYAQMMKKKLLNFQSNDEL